MLLLCDYVVKMMLHVNWAKRQKLMNRHGKGNISLIALKAILLKISPADMPSAN